MVKALRPLWEDIVHGVAATGWWTSGAAWVPPHPTAATTLLGFRTLPALTGESRRRAAASSPAERFHLVVWEETQCTHDSLWGLFICLEEHFLARKSGTGWMDGQSVVRDVIKRSVYCQLNVSHEGNSVMTKNWKKQKWLQRHTSITRRKKESTWEGNRRWHGKEKV